MIRKSKIELKEYISVLNHKDVPKILKWILKPESFNYENFDRRWLFVFGDDQFLTKSHISENFREKVFTSLKNNYNPLIAEKFFALINLEA